MFPTAHGRSLRASAALVNSSAQFGAATGTFTPGTRRLAFGLNASSGAFIYAPTAVYIAKSPGAPAQGPFLAPADPMTVPPADRSAQNAGPGGIQAIYAAELPIPARRDLHRAGDHPHQQGPDRRAGRDRRRPVLADSRRRPAPARDRHRHAGHRPRQRQPAHHAPPARADAFGLLQPGAGQAPDRAAVLDPAVLRLAGMRAGDRRHRRAPARVRQPDRLHPRGGLRQQPAQRACARR